MVPRRNTLANGYHGGLDGGGSHKTAILVID